MLKIDVKTKEKQNDIKNILLDSIHWKYNIHTMIKVTLHFVGIFSDINIEKKYSEMFLYSFTYLAAVSKSLAGDVPTRYFNIWKKYAAIQNYYTVLKN